MATIDLSNLTINPKEQGDFGKFVMERTFLRPELKAVHNVMTGIKMKEQIVLASQLGLSGKLANGCTAVSSGAGSVLTQKYWDPASIEDTLSTCIKSQNSMFKAYADKIEKYKDTYDMTGSDEELFITALVEEAMKVTIARAIWFADTTVSASTSSGEGLISSANVPFFNYFDGLWKQIFTGVSAGTIAKTTISAMATPQNAYDAVNAVYMSASAKLRQDENAQFLVDGVTFMLLEDYLISKGGSNETQYAQDGFKVIKFKGYNVINAETIWSANEYFEAKQGDGAGSFLPNRIVFTTPANIPVGTLNDEDFSDIESWYEKADKTNYTRYGFTLDAKVLSEDLIAVAY
ncbi:MAG: hypothetical protein MJ197_08825 [Bacteroidales bacterium]|nr:hypothetical protein [Bacteroidales bacterium]